MLWQQNTKFWKILFNEWFKNCKSKENDAAQELLKKRVNDLIAKVKEQDVELKKAIDSNDKQNFSEQAFRCSECSAEFKTKIKLKKHYKMIHLFEEIKDKDCHKKFKTTLS